MKSRGGTSEYRSIWILLAGFGMLSVVILALCLASYRSLPDNIGRALTETEAAEVASRNSPLTEYVYLSPNASFPREDAIRKITIHHMAGDLSLDALGQSFSDRDRRASANYAIDSGGKVALYVEEANRAWTSSSPENDHQAVTIEVANDEIGGSWHVSDQAFDALILLCTDICRRNGIERLVYTGDASGTLTTHKMFYSDTECPGPYLESRMAEIAETVNQRLSGA